jgi:hypothetical protein
LHFVNVDELHRTSPPQAVAMVRRIVLGGLALLVLASCSGLGGLGASDDAQYEALEDQARFATSHGAGGGFCDLVQRATDAGGMTPPLAYPVDVLQRYHDEHC